MFSAVPPRPDDAVPAGGGWGVRRSARLAFPDPARRARDAMYTERRATYVRDMLREYGLEPSQGGPERGGQSYGEMAEALIGLAVPEREAVDLLVLAYGVPDIDPGRNMAALLSSRCRGAPLAFGVSDQGAASPYTGLRLIREYSRTAGLRRALLLVVEQAELPYDAGVPVAVPDGHTGVALLFGGAAEESPSAASIRLGTVVTRAGCRDEALAHEISALCAGSPGATVILGAALAQRVAAPVGADRVRTAPAGRPCTGVWWELADELSEADGTPRRLVLGDYDPVQSCLCLAVLEVEHADGPVPADAPSTLMTEPIRASL